jgi:hypothetical protein
MDGSDVGPGGLVDRHAAASQSTITLPTYIKARRGIHSRGTDYLASVDPLRER